MNDEFSTIFIILNDRYIFGIVSTPVESMPLSLTENRHLSLKVPITEFFLFSHLNLNITLRTSVKKIFNLHLTRIL